MNRIASVDLDPNEKPKVARKRPAKKGKLWNLCGRKL
jgi:hypothetical protein